MRVTKYVHSCLLVEDKSQRILIDPGQYSWDSRLLDIGKIGSLSHIIITHEHVDHYFEPALKMIATYSPHAQIITNNDLAEKIKALNLPNQVAGGSSKGIVVFEAPHAPLPLRTPSPLNIGVHISGKLTHSGDALDFKSTRPYLALPLTGPFTSLTQSLKAVVKLKPKALLPVHDWHWHQQARVGMYGWAKSLLAKHGIEFIELENTEAVEL